MPRDRPPPIGSTTTLASSSTAPAASVIGGPMGDAGLTGPQDHRRHLRRAWPATAAAPSRVRTPPRSTASANYAARWVAKNVVAAGLASRFEVQLAYVIGKAEPVSVNIETFGTGKAPGQRNRKPPSARSLTCVPGVIIRDLGLRRRLYRQVAAYGHFGRDDLADVPWEQNQPRPPTWRGSARWKQPSANGGLVCPRSMTSSRTTPVTPLASLPTPTTPRAGPQTRRCGLHGRAY